MIIDLSLSFFVILLIQIAKSETTLNHTPTTYWLTHEQGQKPQDFDGFRKITELLARVGPNMRASSDYHDFTDIHLNESLLAWKTLHNQSLRFAENQVHFYGPLIEQLLIDSNVNKACLESAKLVLDSMKRLDSWAIQMWSFTGNFPPVGLFGGQFTDLGSYRGCIDLKISQNGTPIKTHLYTNYCSLTFRPIVPSRPRFHMIFQKEHQDLLSLFNQTDIFRDLAEKAQYFHYVYMKTGVCVPHQCSAIDIQRVANHLGKKLVLMTGPVRCFTAAPPNPTSNTQLDLTAKEPILIETRRSMNRTQLVAACILGVIFGLIILATIWHMIELWILHRFPLEDGSEYGIDSGEKRSYNVRQEVKLHRMKHVAFEYLSIITSSRDFFDTSMKTSEIKCLHGLRVITMLWIIVVHTLQYNEWSGFTRIFENVSVLQNPILHPLYNANYLVDNFFFMSGLLSSYTLWLANKGSSTSYSPISSFIGRYLRLTPQVMLISLFYILLPLMGDSPFWYDMTHEAGRYCEKNWWLNLLYMQGFYRVDEICNLVSWWISVDMLYYVVALALIYMILEKKCRIALLVTGSFVASCIAVSIYLHYTGQFPPNNLGVVPQVGEVWTNYVVQFSWSPYPHAYPFCLGLWVGYLLATNKGLNIVKNWPRWGWIISSLSLLITNMSSHIWMAEWVKLGSQLTSTSYNNICTIVWISALAWMVVACHYGYALCVDKFSSMKVVLVMSKASFITYLSHMLIVRIYFGSQNTLLELSTLSMIYVLVGNIFLSSSLGIFLCIVFEGPCMKFQKFVSQKIKAKSQSHDKTERKLNIIVGPLTNSLLK